MDWKPRWISAFGFTAALTLLVAVSAVAALDYFVVIMLIVVVGAVGFFYVFFPGSRFFSIALVNALSVYTSLFVFFVETNFEPVSNWAAYVSYTFPVLAFLGGAWLRRQEITAIVTAHRVRDERRIGRVLVWLLPVFAVGAATFAVPGSELDQTGRDVTLLLAMASIALVVIAVSREVSTFLLDTGLLFEEFFQRARLLIVPAFAFLTFYSLLVIVFACFYRILDRFVAAPLFLIGGEHRDITFAESVYFSVVTLSTVGYGDILPESSFIRVVVAVEVVLGVLLLLFGFSEILGYSRSHRRNDN